ncbi:Aste57867_17010 [Aphanomyces stellatus]|uniref:Aste57867_17010 protein n=1 Tax=Aphanomyces stellatus TaxID=120398 RepID=A0A485L8M9_9STRA|nr:hypothetical protein As57867_016952 [Aphanomyces stellatus]VFT93771.1 Aste57867_17010 [Aphanomyces stellatus]
MTMEVSHHADGIAAAGVRPSTAVAMFRETDWRGRATELKGTDEYEASFQRTRRRRMILIAAVCFVVVGAAIGIIATTNKSVQGAEVGSGSDRSSDDAVVRSNDAPAPATTTTTDVDLSGFALASSPPPDVAISDVLVGGSATSSDAPLVATSSNSSNLDIVQTSSSPESTAMNSTNATSTDAPQPTTTSAPSTPAPPTLTPAPTTTTTAPPPPTTLPPLSRGQIRFVNRCAPSTLWRSHTKLVSAMLTGDSVVVDGTKDSSKAYYLADVDNGDYSLFENHFSQGKFWYDLSIIPFNCGPSWKTCNGKPPSFNHPIAVAVSSPDKVSCRNLNCPDRSCADAYVYPDQEATHACPSSVSMVVTFC